MERYFIKIVVAVAFLNVFSLSSFAQESVSDSLKKIPVVIEAEDGTVGSNFQVGQDGGISYIAPVENYTDQSSPGDASRTIKYQVSFQDTGYYNLFARVRVGTGGFNDDSFFAGNGFGEKAVASGGDWVFVNGLASAGFVGSTDYVDDQGTAGSEVWKWVNVTKNYFPGAANELSFYVSPGNLTQTFEIGSREDGLEIDKLAFGKSNLFYTVSALDNGLPGTETRTNGSSGGYQGPPLADGLNKFLGNVMASDNLFANYWNQITPGNEGKWGSIAYSSDTLQWNWSGLDNLYNFAKDHHILFKGHNLVWGQQQPSWISGLDPATQLQYIETWIRKVGQRYPAMDMMDVVNEPLKGHNPPDGVNGRANYKNALGGDGQTGWDWVIKSFELARKYLPNTKLLLNDYGIINDYNATANYLKIISLLNDRGLVDGIGVQCHRFELEYASNATLKSNLDRLAATGLPIYISEMDLGNLNNEGVPDDQQQLQLYKRIFPVLWDHPDVKGITLWGYLEGEMWQSSCYLVRKDGSWRPALTWIADYIKKPTGIKSTLSSMTDGVVLKQNFPNPFSTSTTITFSIGAPSKVSLKIYNMTGAEVATLVAGSLNAGLHTITWKTNDTSGNRLENGMYYCRLVVDQNVFNRKMMLVK